MTRRSGRPIRIFAVLLILGLVFSACGRGGEDTSKKVTGVAGGTLRIAAGEGVDHIDPGKGYLPFSSMLFRVMTRNLVTYPAVAGDAGNRLVEDIATTTDGVVSADGRTYTFTIKPGVKYQPETANGREVTSADFRYAIERGFYPSVANPYARLYFGNLFQGDEAFLAAPGPNVHISGIGAGSPRTVVFKLKRATGDFLYRLSQPLAAPVPAEYARAYDAKAVSDYGPNFAATGPYQLERTGGRVTGYVANRKITMVRNQNWSKGTDSIRRAYPDRFEVTEGLEDTVIATDKILGGEYDYNGDFTIPQQKLDGILADPAQKELIRFSPSGCFRYVSLNTRIRPFNRLEVRQAVATVLNRAGMRAVSGGERAGEIATHALIPGVTGFEQSGGREYDPYPSKDFEGDVEKAKALMVKAEYPSGMYDGRPVSMVFGSTGTVSGRTADVIEASLAKIGIRVKREGYATTAMYTQYLQVPEQDVAVGANPRWCWDYPDASTIIKPLFDGREIRDEGNNNYSELNDTALNTLIDQAAAATGTKRADLWAAANKRVMQLAPIIPWLWESQPHLISNRVVGYQFSLSSSSMDLAVVSLRPES